MSCNCGLNKSYRACCEIFHKNASLISSAEELMRSRYCAYTLHLVDYIYETTHPKERKGIRKADILDWAVRNKWMGLEIMKATQYTVEFKAHYLDENLEPRVHHEKSAFEQLNNKWYFVKGTYPGK